MPEIFVTKVHGFVVPSAASTILEYATRRTLYTDAVVVSGVSKFPGISVRVARAIHFSNIPKFFRHTRTRGRGSVINIDSHGSLTSTAKPQLDRVG
jgi:hypothetical protein